MARATCVNCGHEFDFHNDPPFMPCPDCGETRRNQTITMGCGAVEVSGISPVVVVRPPKGSLTVLFDFLEIGDADNEGQVIKAVAPAWWKLLEYLKENPNEIFQLPPRKFEELVAAAYKSEGWDVKLTPRSGDNGIDVIAEKPGMFKFRIHDQAKLYKPGRVVTAEEVRALLHTIHPAGMNKGASMGVVTTSSSFAPRIEKDPSISGYMPHHLTLIDGENLFRRLNEIRKPKS